MFRPRVIPILLLRNKGLVKTVKFKDYRYIGDPINAVKIFNDLKTDELIFLDILAGKEKRTIPLEFIKNVGEEANMPFGVGGGIRTMKQIEDTVAAGAEKVVINTKAVQDPGFIKTASDTFGSSTITVCIDVKKNFFGHEKVWMQNGRKQSSFQVVEFSKDMEQMGAGEIIIQSIPHDGTMNGYALSLIKSVSESVSIPVVAAGGAGSLTDFREAYITSHASAVAAGSLFVYHGPRRGILINYPSREEIQNLFTDD